MNNFKFIVCKFLSGVNLFRDGADAIIDSPGHSVKDLSKLLPAIINFEY